MKRSMLLTFTALVLVGCNNSTISKNQTNSVTYPSTKKVDTITNYFGTQVKDPYRWLEDDMSQQTAQWVENQNKTTFGYLDNIPFREALKQRLTKLWNYEKVGAPFKEGDYSYFYKNDGLQNQYVIYRYKTGQDSETAEVFLDPNTFTEDGTISLGGLSFSENGLLAAYSISEGGSDWRKVLVMDTQSKQIIEDTIVDVKFSGVSWFKNDGFYYSSYDKPKGSELSAKTDQHKLYYHKLGSSQKEDRLVFGGTPREKHRYVGGRTTQDNKYLIVSASVSTSGNKLFIKDLSDPKNPFITIQKDTDSDTSVIENVGSTLYLVTNKNAPNKKVVMVDASSPGPENWKDLIKETQHVLRASTGGGYIFANYMKDAVSVIKQYSYSGALVREVALPGVGSAGGFGAKEKDKNLYYSFTNYLTPGSIYSFDISSGVSKLCKKPNIDFNSDEYQSKQVFYTSKDGTQVPMIITHKKGIVLDGTNPTILYGYGGFNISRLPGFSKSYLSWMNQGGVVAVVNLRGGGEYGDEWHDAGRLFNKQNVFDDFAYSAKFLHEREIGSPSSTAIQGGSNGGLLVAATMLQNPNLFEVAIPQVGVLDMLRFHKFTIGWAWESDYGSPDKKDEFENLLAYSPLHNIVKDECYPTTLITTAKRDDRVVPSHSFKFAAKLQEYQGCDNPILIRVEGRAGHGAGTPKDKIINQVAEVYGYALSVINND